MRRALGGLKFVLEFSLIAILILTCGSMARAQETTGTIKAYVKDKTGASIPTATVELAGSGLITARKLQADEAGFVAFSLVPPGDYTLTANATNFQAVKVGGIRLDVGREPTFNLVLEVGQVTQTIEVTASAVLVDVTTSNVATAIPQDVIENIPKGRSFQSLIPFAPGARGEPLQSFRTDRGRQNGFQIDGASDSENTYLVEGLDTSDIQSGGIKQNVIFEFVQEVQVKTSGLAAEFGGAMGGVVNVIQKRGGNEWHGSLVSYFRSNQLDANDQCLITGQPNGSVTPSGQQISCGLRAIPGTSINTTTRTDAAFEYYNQKQDKYSIIDPGYEIGGPILKNKLWLFSSYVPTIDKDSRLINFTGTNSGPRTLTRTFTQQNLLNRLDYQPFSKLHLYGSWQSGYSRITGQLPGTPDSFTVGQVNTAASSDPTTFRPDRGSVNPQTLLNFGGEYTPNARTVVTAKYGYDYYNSSDRGLPVGVRYLFQETLGPATTDITGAAANPPASSANTSGFANIAANQATLFDVFSRKTFNTDFSYFLSKWGTHNFKVGYQNNRLFNNVNVGYNTALVNIYWGDAYTTVSPTNNCTAINAQNVTTYGTAGTGASATKCRGKEGYYTIMDGIDTAGKASSMNHGIYFQDSWTVGHGLTLNLGVRLDKEYLPPYATGYPSVSFGFGAKAAPRIGGAYDLFHNGKLKIFADYAKFYDIMKFSLPRGSFGGEYWHDCTYAMDTFNYTNILPTAPGGHACGPDQGPAAGVTEGRFIENMNWRAAVPPSTVDPGIDPQLKPASQHEMIIGTDWAIQPNLGLEVRYARKRLDNTIEDMSVDDNTYYIGNPGDAFSNVLHRQLPSAGFSSTSTPPVGATGLCPTCPPQPKAIRAYDGLETRLTYRSGAKLFGQISYTWSRLHGNYSGLTDTDITDANGGRHNANNNRSFDIPEMQYTTSGKVNDGPLGTDRPNVLSMTGYYKIKWWKMTSTIGGNQLFAQGAPKSTCIPVIDSTSACQYYDQRGEFANFHRDTTGNLVLDSVTMGARSPMYAQTDLNLAQDFGVSKTNEAMKVTFEANITNLLNNNSPIAYTVNPYAGGNEWLKFTSAGNAAGTDFLGSMTGYNVAALSNSGSLIYNNRYGLPLLFQSRRTIRLAVRFTF